MTRFLRNVLSNYAVVVVDGVLLILVTPYIVQKLGLTAYSVWIIAHTLGYYLGFLDLGVADAQVRQHAQLKARKDPEAMERLHGTARVVFVIAGIAGVVIAILAILTPIDSLFGVPDELQAVFAYAIVAISLTNLVSFVETGIDGVFEGEERFDLVNGVDMATSAGEALSIVLALYAGYGLLALAGLQLTFTLVSCFAKQFLLRRSFPDMRPAGFKFDRQSWNDIRHFSVWDSLNEFVTEGTAHFDKLLIPVLLATAMVAPYSLVILIAAAIFAISEPITDTFLPMFSRLSSAKNQTATRALLDRGSRLVVAVSLPVSIVVILFGNALLDLWIGAEYTDIHDSVLWLTGISFFFSTVFWTPLSVLMAAGLVKKIFWISALEVALALGLIIALVPVMALPGLALAGLIANVATGFVFFLPPACELAGETMVRYLQRTLIRPLLAAVPAILIGALLLGAIDSGSWWQTLSAAALTGLTGVAGLVIFALPGRERLRYYVAARRLVGSAC